MFPIIISIIDDWCYETSCHHFDKIMVVTMTWLAITEYLCYKWPRICFFVAITIRSFPHSWLITGFVTIVTRRVPHVEQEVNNIQAHMSSTPYLGGVRIARPCGFYVMFYTSFLSVCPCSFCHCIICPSSIYGFWLSLWYFDIFFPILLFSFKNRLMKRIIVGILYRCLSTDMSNCALR